MTEYYKHKRSYDTEVSKTLDALSDEELSVRMDKIWAELLNFESILLLPGNKPKKCNTETCNALLCKYCYDNKSKICLECSENNTVR
jgi:hypothetical protein